MKINSNKILLVRIAWMKYYEGRAHIDEPRSGAKYILENKTGGEQYNFKNQNGIYFGYIPYVGTVNIDNLGANPKDVSISGITVVYCATHPVEKGMRVVGWYNNATVYRHTQFTKNNKMYFVEANPKDIFRIEHDNRLCNIPNTFGRSALFYFALHSEKNKTLNKLIKYISSKGLSENENNKKANRGNLNRQSEIEKRILVEKNAINVAINYYAARYGLNNIKSVEKDNVGWDLEINTGTVKLKVEVKGLSGNSMSVELTPNEFKALNKRHENYFLFIVTEALSKKPNYEIFTVHRKQNKMIGHLKTELNINKVIGARIN